RQTRPQSGMFRRQADLAVVRLQGLLKTYAQPVLIAAGDQRRSARGAYGGIGIGLQETNAVVGNRIDIRCAQVRAPVAGDIGKAEIVGENEDNVRWSVGLAE